MNAPQLPTSIPPCPIARSLGALALVGAVLLAACDVAEEPALQEEDTPTTTAEPLPDADLVSPEAPHGSQCGNTLDFQPVESYDGTLGPTTQFVDAHERPVAQIRWRSDLSTQYTNTATVNGARWCSGTLVSRNLLLTAGHCFDMQAAEDKGIPTPRNNGAMLDEDEAAAAMFVEMNFQEQRRDAR